MTIKLSVCPQHRKDSGIWRAPRRPAARWLCYSPTYGFRGRKGSTSSHKRDPSIRTQDGGRSTTPGPIPPRPPPADGDVISGRGRPSLKTKRLSELRISGGELAARAFEQARMFGADF